MITPQAVRMLQKHQMCIVQWEEARRSKGEQPARSALYMQLCSEKLIKSIQANNYNIPKAAAFVQLLLYT
jgi:hypothetical protein